MGDPDQMTALRWAFSNDHLALTAHAALEALEETMEAEDIARAGRGAELLEDYPDRPEGHTKLLLGYARVDEPIHIVVNVEGYESDWTKPLGIVTVYRPEPPPWLDERTRRRR